MPGPLAHGSCWWRIAPWLAPALCLYPSLAGLLGQSQQPVIWGRYSPALAAYNLWQLGWLAAAAFGIAGRRLRQTECSLLALIVATYPCLANNSLLAAPGIVHVLRLIRIVAAAHIVVVEFRLADTTSVARRRIFLGVATVILTFSVLDLALGCLPSPARQHAGPLTAKLRDPGRSPESTGAGGIIIVGDSFVWGTGVPAADTFSARLAESLGRNAGADRPHVYAFGIQGAGPVVYNRILRRVPPDVAASAIVLSLYLNDLQPPENHLTKLANALRMLGTSAPTLRLIGDSAARVLHPDIDTYHQQQVASHDPTGPQFEQRWRDLANSLETFRKLAAERCERPPILMIIPLMVDFRHYPLDAAHARIAALGRKLGYEMLDLLPVFRREIRDGTKARVTADNSHFDAATHQLVAEQLLPRLTAPPVRP